MEYIGTIETSIAKQLKGKSGHIKTALAPYGSGVYLSDSLKDEVDKMRNEWSAAGYLDSEVVEWTNFYPGKHFVEDKSLYEKLGVVPKNVWASGINPGRCVPWHWDIEDQAAKWEDEGELVRFTVFIDAPVAGGVFIVGDHCFHNIPQHSVYKWNVWNDYHAGTNCGLRQKYILHIVGISTWK